MSEPSLEVQELVAAVATLGQLQREQVTAYIASLRAALAQAEREREDISNEYRAMEAHMLNRIAEADDLRAEVARLKDAYSRMNAEIEQTLAQAIGGYPWYKDDQKNFPGATEKDGVCVGDHVAESLALEAANLITTQKTDLARVRAALIDAEEILGNLAEGWLASEDAGVNISTSADLDYVRDLLRRYRTDAKLVAAKARAALEEPR